MFLQDIWAFEGKKCLNLATVGQFISMMDGRSIASSPLSHSAALIKAPQAASAEHAFSSTLTHVCCLNGRKAETERNKHGWCWYSYTCVSVYSCVYLSVIRATHEKVEAA